MQKTFICPSCRTEKPMSRASKRVREGMRKVDRCLDCEADAQRRNRMERGEEIRARQRLNYPRHKEKQKDTLLKKKYGISLFEWNARFEQQGGSCAICHTDTPKGNGWQTDHNHGTGLARGILCHHCNSLLGHAMESPGILLSAFRYLCVHGGGAEKFISQHFKSSEKQHATEN